jgi:type IV pilus assembly protein PilM
MPVLSDKELTSAIYWEAEQYIPVPLDTITFDYRVLRRPESVDEAPKMDVLLVGSPTALIDKYEKILSLGGLSLAAVETEILSSIRAIVTDKSFPATLIITIGAVSTSLAIIKSGILVFTYNIPTGGVALSRAIAADLGFSISQAEEYKKVYGIFTNGVEGKIGKATEPVLSSIISEMKKALIFYSEKYRDDPLQQIILSGGSAKLPGLNTFFTKNIGIPTGIANPWSILSSQDIPKEIIDNAADYTIAVGLAMKEYE